MLVRRSPDPRVTRLIEKIESTIPVLYAIDTLVRELRVQENPWGACIGPALRSEVYGGGSAF